MKPQRTPPRRVERAAPPPRRRLGGLAWVGLAILLSLGGLTGVWSMLRSSEEAADLARPAAMAAADLGAPVREAPPVLPAPGEAARSEHNAPPLHRTPGAPPPQRPVAAPTSPAAPAPGASAPSADAPPEWDGTGEPTREWVRRWMSDWFRQHRPAEKLSPRTLELAVDAAIELDHAMRELDGMLESNEDPTRAVELEERVRRANADLASLTGDHGSAIPRMR